MAKTIKEMATLQEVNVKDRASYEKGYVDGASAVLEEVVKFMEDDCRVTFESYVAVKNKIKKLKGE